MVCYVANWADKYISERLSEYGKSPQKGVIECTVIVTAMKWSKIIKKHLFNIFVMILQNTDKVINWA